MLSVLLLWYIEIGTFLAATRSALWWWNSLTRGAQALGIGLFWRGPQQDGLLFEQ